MAPLIVLLLRNLLTLPLTVLPELLLPGPAAAFILADAGDKVGGFKKAGMEEASFVDPLLLSTAMPLLKAMLVMLLLMLPPLLPAAPLLRRCDADAAAATPE